VCPLTTRLSVSHRGGNREAEALAQSAGKGLYGALPGVCWTAWTQSHGRRWKTSSMPCSEKEYQRIPVKRWGSGLYYVHGSKDDMHFGERPAFCTRTRVKRHCARVSKGGESPTSMP